MESLSLEEPSPAELLPPELWESIFLHLSTVQLLTVRLTCRRWKEIVSNSPTLREKFSVRITEGIEQLNLPPVSKVYIGSIGIFYLDNWWPTLAARLVSLKLDDCELTLATLIAMLAQAPVLKKLKLNRINSLTDCDCEVNYRLEKLEKLAVGWVDYENVLECFTGLCPRLKTFKIHGVQKDERMEGNIIHFVQAVQDTLEYIALCPSGRLLAKISNLSRLKLKRIQFGKCDFSQGQLIEFCRINSTIEDVTILELYLTTRTLDAIGSHLSSLKRLWVSFDQAGTIIPTFLRFMQRLERLNLYGKNFVEQTLDLTGYANPSLKELYLTRLPTTLPGLRQYLEASTQIRNLSLEDATLRKWPQDVFSLVQPLQNLKELVLFFVEIEENTNEVAQYQLEQLKLLIFSHCKIPNRILLQWIKQCPKLEELWLTAVETVDEAFVLTVIETLSRLRVLNVAACQDSSLSAKVFEECCARCIKFSCEIYA